ncbi:MAG: response regulator, partial [Steroidobacteraceae bacterium]
VHPADRELLELVAESIGIAVRSAKDRTRLEELLDETQRQSQELQAQQEELRVSNEELQEQGHILKESQARLEAQQAELEQTNSQLEEQALMLETQRDELSRAQNILQEKATELERSNQYKSEFLANMSHELRTPLNSTLILARLLADNKGGNLTAEQVKFAQTISGAGNDLLALINDILDLSKIEAGKIEIRAEPVHVARTLETLHKSLQPMAQEKGLNFSVSTAADASEQMRTDAQRLGQILKNLLSNALKFTQQGEVSLHFSPGPGETVLFAVRDTGIGIPSDQQEVIFEAFRQADGSTHRKYGGTGLGLSISRDLARLLGGDITVQSTPGQGSTFILSLPVNYQGPAETRRRESSAATVVATAPRHVLAPPPVQSMALPSPRPLPSPLVDDDRDHLKTGARVILAVEDDTRFAAILRDLAHELDFQCIITHSADAGLAAAALYVPSAILLDMNLPDHSGLGVLDQLKRNPLTRHIPVHVISVADYSQEALELGAVGYALKPVKREELVRAFEHLAAKFTQGVRTVLVVEDDARQRDSIGQLLGNEEVRIVGVGTATEALKQLQAATFDCMVIDLNLPDLSGYELLEKMADAEDVSFPPVIVYTGRSLTRDEEQRLRRFSKSIIIKDARSPERLLDEVTLFLHQVEAKLPAHHQRMLKDARHRETALEGKRILIVEDDVRNVYALTSLLEPRGAHVEIARNGKEALQALEASTGQAHARIDMVLMDIMMPEMDGFTAMREIRKHPQWGKLPIIALTAKAMKDDNEKCLAAGANDYIAKPLDVERLLSLVRVWMPR